MLKALYAESALTVLYSSVAVPLDAESAALTVN